MLSPDLLIEINIAIGILLVFLFYILWSRLIQYERDMAANSKILLEISKVQDKRIDLLYQNTFPGIKRNKCSYCDKKYSEEIDLEITLEEEAHPYRDFLIRKLYLCDDHKILKEKIANKTYSYRDYFNDSIKE